jgi:hypothetical protein
MKIMDLEFETWDLRLEISIITPLLQSRLASMSYYTRIP